MASYAPVPGTVIETPKEMNQGGLAWATHLPILGQWLEGLLDKDERKPMDAPALQKSSDWAEPEPIPDWVLRRDGEHPRQRRPRPFQLRFVDGRAFSPFTTEPEEPPTPIVKLAKPQTLQRPKWLRNTYRPAGLTEHGVLMLESLAPDGTGACGYPFAPLPTLTARRALLGARYAALDMVQRGHAFEVLGTYHHIARKPDEDRIRSWALSMLPRSNDAMDSYELLTWLATYRVATLDQIATLDPVNADNNVFLLMEWEREGLVKRAKVPLGMGEIEIWFLGKHAWDRLRSEDIHMEARGFGPPSGALTRTNGMLSSSRPGRWILHHLLQVDAIGWFRHQVIAEGGRMTGVVLDRALRTGLDGEAVPHFLDFRVEYVNDRGIRGFFDVEVVGTGSDYRNLAKKKIIERSPLNFRFSSVVQKSPHERFICIGR
jgi:hypothetical protein